MSTMGRADLGIALPPSWRRTSDPDSGVLVSARPVSTPASGFRPHVVLRCGPATGELDDWCDQEMAELARRLSGFEVEDDDTFDLMGHDVAYRRFAHRLGAADVLCDQWGWLVDGLGVTLTCSVAREDYWDYCDVFEAIAATVETGSRAA